MLAAMVPWWGCLCWIWEITGGCTSPTRASRGSIPNWKCPEQMRCFWRMKYRLWEQPELASTLRRFCSTPAGAVPGALPNDHCPGDWGHIPDRLSNFYHHLHVSGRQKCTWHTAPREHWVSTAAWGCSSGIQKGLITVFSSHFPFAVMKNRAYQSVANRKREICRLLLIELFLKRHTLTWVASVSPKILQHMCLLSVDISMVIHINRKIEQASHALRKCLPLSTGHR